MNPFSVMKILSESEALQLVEQEPNKWNVISIFSDERETPNPPKFSFPKSIVQINFHDIDAPEGNLILCEEKHVAAALEFARGVRGEPLLIHCAAGVCRSTAMGFLVMLDALKDVSDNPAEDAIKYIKLVRPMAYPNRHVIEVGVPLIAKNDEQAVKWFRELYASSTFRRMMGI